MAVIVRALRDASKGSFEARLWLATVGADWLQQLDFDFSGVWEFCRTPKIKRNSS